MEPIDDDYLGLNMHKRETSHKKGMQRSPAERKHRTVGYKRPSHMGSMSITKGRNKPHSKPKYVGAKPNLDKLVKKM